MFQAAVGSPFREAVKPPLCVPLPPDFCRTGRTREQTHFRRAAAATAPESAISAATLGSTIS